MQVIKFEKNQLEDDIFKQLRGKTFFAISAVENKDGDIRYEWYTKDMNPEVIVMACGLLTHTILSGEYEEME